MLINYSTVVTEPKLLVVMTSSVSIAYIFLDTNPIALFPSKVNMLLPTFGKFGNILFGCEPDKAEVNSTSTISLSALLIAFTATVSASSA